MASLALAPALARAQSAPPAAAFPAPSGAAPSSSALAPTNGPPAPASTNGATEVVPASPAAVAPPPAAAPAPPPPPPPYPALYPLTPGYAYGYYYPPLPPPLPAPQRFPEDAAVASTPFFDAIVLVADWQHRFSEAVNLGAQAGVYVGGRVRLTAKLAFPTESMGDREADFGSGSKDPSFFYAFSAGYAAVRTPTFAFSPGLLFARTDVSDYGTMIGLSAPLDWVTRSGLRLGLEGGLGRAFGGKESVSCTTDCDLPPRFRERDGGVALWLEFQIGFGFNHPGPLTPEWGRRADYFVMPEAIAVVT